MVNFSVERNAIFVTELWKAAETFIAAVEGPRIRVQVLQVRDLNQVKVAVLSLKTSGTVHVTENVL